LVAADASRVCGLSQVTNAISDLDDDEKMALTVARQLGHVNLRMLHQMYAHVTPDMTKEAVELAAKASSPSRAKSRPVA
jgi:integrase